MENWKIKYKVKRCNGREERTKTGIFSLVGDPLFCIDDIRRKLDIPLYDKITIISINYK